MTAREGIVDDYSDHQRYKEIWRKWIECFRWRSIPRLRRHQWILSHRISESSSWNFPWRIPIYQPANCTHPGCQAVRKSIIHDIDTNPLCLEYPPGCPNNQYCSINEWQRIFRKLWFIIQTYQHFVKRYADGPPGEGHCGYYYVAREVGTYHHYAHQNYRQEILIEIRSNCEDNVKIYESGNSENTTTTTIKLIFGWAILLLRRTRGHLLCWLMILGPEIPIFLIVSSPPQKKVSHNHVLCLWTPFFQFCTIDHTPGENHWPSINWIWF